MEQFIFTLKKFWKKMALNIQGRLLTGKEAEDKLKADQLKTAGSSELTAQEVQFILTKLRQAQYTGSEFELFYIIFTKLSQLLPNK